MPKAKEVKKPVMKLCINRCPIHPSFWSVSIDGEGGGTRMTNGKCCGRWEEQKSWVLTPEMCDEAVNLFVQAKEVISQKE